MRTRQRTRLVWFSLIAVLAVSAPATAGKIVINHDEWTLSDTGFSNPSNDPGQFATNVAAWFTGGGPASLRVWSTNFGLTHANLANAMTGAGHTWQVSDAGTFDLATLQTYDAVFLAGAAPLALDYDTVLINYIEAGGNVYLAGGTGVGGAAGEADRWNLFLNHFGLGLVGTSYNGVGGDIPINSPHPIFAGVDQLFQNNGNSIVDLAPADPRNQILVSQGQQGLYAIYDAPSRDVPLPATPALLLIGVGALVTRRKSTRRA